MTLGHADPMVREETELRGKGTRTRRGLARASANLSSSDIKAGRLKYFVHETFIGGESFSSDGPNSGHRSPDRGINQSRDDLSTRCKGHNRCLDGRRIGSVIS